MTKTWNTDKLDYLHRNDNEKADDDNDMWYDSGEYYIK